MLYSSYDAFLKSVCLVLVMVSLGTRLCPPTGSAGFHGNLEGCDCASLVMTRGHVGLTHSVQENVTHSSSPAMLSWRLELLGVSEEPHASLQPCDCAPRMGSHLTFTSPSVGREEQPHLCRPSAGQPGGT